VHPGARRPVLEAHVGVARHERVAARDRGLVQLEDGGLVGAGHARQRVDRVGGLAAQLGAHRVLAGVLVHLGGQVAARGQVLEAEQVGPARGASAARVLLHQLHLPQRLGRRGRGGRQPRRAPDEHALLAAVVVVGQVLLLLGVEQPDHVALKHRHGQRGLGAISGPKGHLRS